MLTDELNKILGEFVQVVWKKNGMLNLIAAVCFVL